MFLISIPTHVFQNCHRTLITALLILKNGKTHLHTFSTPQPIDKLVMEPCQIQIQHVNSLFRSTFLNTFHHFLIPTPMIIKSICQQIFRLQKCNESFSNNLITSRQKHNLFQRHLFCLHQNHSKNFKNEYLQNHLLKSFLPITSFISIEFASPIIHLRH